MKRSIEKKKKSCISKLLSSTSLVVGCYIICYIIVKAGKIAQSSIKLEEEK